MSNTLEIRDRSWVRNAFLAPTGSYADRERYRRSNGWMKFTDTTLGGNWAINVPYQFTRYADIKERRLARDVGKGMGRWYSSNIDDYGHNVHFRVGVPAYNGLLAFAATAVDGATARLVATGRTSSIMLKLGQIGGWILSIAFWEITLITTLVQGFLKFMNTRFYYLKPTMHQYWETVQILLNNISANLGISYTPPGEVTDSGYKMDHGSYSDHMRKNLPDIFRSPVRGLGGANGGGQDVGIDIFAVTQRAEALRNQQDEFIHSAMKNMRANSITELANQLEKKYASGPVYQGNNIGNLRPGMATPTLNAYKKSYYIKGYQGEIAEKTEGRTVDENNKSGSVKGWFEETIDSWKGIVGKNNNERPQFIDRLKSEFRDGTAWFSLRVANANEPVSESFSNSATESELGGVFNSLAEKSRQIAFNLAGGRTGLAPIDNVIDFAVNSVTDFMTGAASKAIPFANPIIGLLHGAQIDIPKRWNGSDASVGGITYKLELRAGYGNVFSIYQDLLVPLCMMLALALPRGTGAQSFGAPFYIEFYSKGRTQSKIGLVKSLSIERGVGNKGWNSRGLPLGIDISISIEDMTNKLYSPTQPSLSILDGKWINMMEDNAMGDYLAVLSALGVQDQTYMKQNFMRRWNMMMVEFNQMTSPARWASWAMNETGPGQIAMMFSGQTKRN